MTMRTPAPWTVGADPVRVFGADGYLVCTPEYACRIAQAVYETDGSAGHWATTTGMYVDVHKGEAEGNAQLIAAAPDLLAACEAQLRVINDMSRFIGAMALEDYKLWNEARIAARAAIKKAGGNR